LGEYFDENGLLPSWKYRFTEEKSVITLAGSSNSLLQELGIANF